MRIKDIPWQSHENFWHPLFIRENLLSLGYTAWQGFLLQGRGLVVCDVDVVDATFIDWSHEVVQYTSQFIPERHVLEYLHALKLDADGMPHLLQTIQTYPPDQDIVLLIRGDGSVNVSLLKGLAVPPPDCYRQVSDRWDEFNSVLCAEPESTDGT